MCLNRLVLLHFGILIMKNVYEIKDIPDTFPCYCEMTLQCAIPKILQKLKRLTELRQTSSQ